MFGCFNGSEYAVCAVSMIPSSLRYLRGRRRVSLAILSTRPWPTGIIAIQLKMQSCQAAITPLLVRFEDPHQDSRTDLPDPGMPGTIPKRSSLPVLRQNRELAAF